MKRIVAFFLLALLAVMGCTRKVQYTTVEIRDPVRHYYPILQGHPAVLRLHRPGKRPRDGGAAGAKHAGYAQV